MAAKMIDYALSYERKFHAVIPCIGKKPIIDNWSSKPLNTARSVSYYWSRWDYNIGLGTGQICGGYIVVDTDRKPEKGIDGYDCLVSWQRETGMVLPDTWTAISGSGGYHFYYHTPKAMRGFVNDKIGVDLRADGNQIILPPSIHPDTGKAYRWEISPRDIECAEADEAVFAFIDYCRPSGAEYKKSTLRGQGGEREMLLPPVIENGGRHNALISLIGHLNRLGVSDEAIEDCVRYENRKCSPQLTEQELQKEIFPAIYRWAKGVDKDEWEERQNWMGRQWLAMKAEQVRRRSQRDN